MSRELHIIADTPLDTAQLSTEQLNQLLVIQKDILELVITSSDYQSTLNALCRAAESIVSNSATSIMLYNPDKTHLDVRAAPNISSLAADQLSGLVPGENAGSCGTAVFKQQPQYISDTSVDKRWVNFRVFAEEFNIQACWSMPIINTRNAVIGSFAVSSFEKRKPSKFQQLLLQICASLASLILMRERDDLAMKKAAYLDPLTQLPNRMLFNMRAEQAKARADRSNKEIAIFFIDLDRFKQVNDEYGHELGDKILESISEHMTERIRKEDTLARFGGDEFVLLVEGISDREELYSIANKLLSGYQYISENQSLKFAVSASVGISLYPKDGNTIDRVIQCADKAMYCAKKSNKKIAEFY
jgi:diguanylate cyclase (GGDEF)-like protein